MLPFVDPLVRGCCGRPPCWPAPAGADTTRPDRDRVRSPSPGQWACRTQPGCPSASGMGRLPARLRAAIRSKLRLRGQASSSRAVGWTEPFLARSLARARTRWPGLTARPGLLLLAARLCAGADNSGRAVKAIATEVAPGAVTILRRASCRLAPRALPAVLFDAGHTGCRTTDPWATDPGDRSRHHPPAPCPRPRLHTDPVPS